jgi:hypothetical protein
MDVAAKLKSLSRRSARHDEYPRPLAAGSRVNNY